MVKRTLLYLACVKDNPNNVRVAVDVIKLLKNKDLEPTGKSIGLK